MAIRALNSIGGFSVGETPVDIILANGDITTVGLAANGNVSFTGSNVSLGDIANLHILGGSSGQLLSTNGSGNLSWTTVSPGTLSNGSSNIQVLNSGNITFSSAGTANVVVITSTGQIIDGPIS